MPECNQECFFTALNFTPSSDIYPDESELKKAYRKASLACHPDKHSPSLKEIATAAQILINNAYETLRDDSTYFNYMFEKWVPEPLSHNCEENIQTLAFIYSQTKPYTPPTPQPEPEPECETNNEQQEDEPNLEQEEMEVEEEEEEEEPEIIIIDDQEETTDANNQTNNSFDNSQSSSSSARSKRRSSRRVSFSPTGFQTQGGEVIDNKQRSQGPMYLVKWAAKPNCTTWLHEEDLVREFPEMAREYINKLREAKSRRLSAIVRKAGPICEFL